MGRMKKKIFVLTFVLMVCLEAFSQGKATVITAKAPEQLYLGAVLDKQSINTDTYRRLDIIQDELQVSFSIPGVRSMGVRSNPESMVQAIQGAVQKNGGVGTQEVSFSAGITELQDYNQLPIYFGQQVNVSNWFALPEKKRKSKSAFVLQLERIAFTVDMDLPPTGQYKVNQALLNKEAAKDLVYINSLNYGRKAIVIIESALAPEVVRPVLNQAVAQKPLSEKEQRILANCSFRVIKIGNNEGATQNTANPLLDALQFVGKKFDLKDYGVPISFGAANFLDHSQFENQF